MAEVATFAKVMEFSLRRLADEFGMSRDLITKRLRTAGVRPSSIQGGHPRYRMRDVAPVLYRADVDGDTTSPENLPPFERSAWYQSEKRRVELLEYARTLIPAGDVEVELASIVKTVVQTIDALPDLLERDLAVAPEVVVYVGKKVDELREILYARITEPERDADARDPASDNSQHRVGDPEGDRRGGEGKRNAADVDAAVHHSPANRGRAGALPRETGGARPEGGDKS